MNNGQRSHHILILEYTNYVKCILISSWMLNGVGGEDINVCVCWGYGLEKVGEGLCEETSGAKTPMI
jgi:hypothetical protein